jgi:hypothetical protein
MKKVYLFLSVIGFIIPNIIVYMVSVETGNYLLLLNPSATIAGMFANGISSAFIADLLVVVFVFFIWSESQAKRYKIKRVWIYWLLTLLFGMAGTFPLFLYMIETRRDKKEHHDKRSSHRKRSVSATKF